MGAATKRLRRQETKGKSNSAVLATAEDVRSLRKRHGLSQTLAARLLGVSVRTISGIESGTPVSPLVLRTLMQLGRLLEALAQAMEPGYTGQWLEEPNQMLDGLKPVEAIERGQLDLVWQIADGLRAGSPL